MKNYDETINTVFGRIDEYNTLQQRKKKIITRIVTPVCCLSLALIVSIGVWQNNNSGNEISTTSDGNSNNTASNESDGTWYGTGQESPPSNSGNNTSTSEDTVGAGPNGIVGDNAINDVIGTVIVDGIQYVQYSVDDKLFTLDKYLGDAREFDGTYKSHINDLTTELYTVKESENILIVKLGNGGTVVLGRCGDIIVNGKLYGKTGISPTQHVVGEFLGTADEFEIIDVPYREKRINPKDEIWSMKDFNDGLFVKTTDGQWVVFYYWYIPWYIP